MPEQKFLTVEHLSRKDIARIFSKIHVNNETGCWEWIGSTDGNGYGTLRFLQRTEGAHRVLYAWLVEPLPRGRGRGIPMLDHFTCDNPPCCNPSHLRLVSHQANITRGSNPAAQHARRTHCSKGHLLPETPNRSDGGRRCVPCRNERSSKANKTEKYKIKQHARNKTDKYRAYQRDYYYRKRKAQRQAARLSSPSESS